MERDGKRLSASLDAHGGVAVLGEPVPRPAQSGIIALTMPTREMVLVALQPGKECPEGCLAGDCLSEAVAERLGLNRRDESLHVAVHGGGAFTTHKQPPASVIWIEAVGSLIKVYEFTRPDGAGLEIDIRLATRRLIDDVREIAEIHPDRNSSLACCSL